jgi:uncharacterized protein (DUF1778 family)
MPTAVARTQRTEARLRPDQKSRIERAARMRGQSLSDFMVQHADHAAKQIIEEERVWKLTEADSKAFVAALLKPPVPNPRLKAAMARFKKSLAVV